MAAQDALAYHEPGIETVLIQTGFLLALNVVNTALDKIIYCGLIGQLFIGMTWGVPGGNLLELGVQKSIQQLGYLGLLLLVYEGEIPFHFTTIRSRVRTNEFRWSINIFLSAQVEFRLFCPGGSHGGWCPHGSLLYPHVSARRNTPLGIRRRSRATIDQHRDHIHHPLHHGTGQDVPRRRPGQRRHDGRRNGVGDGPDNFEYKRR